MHSTIVTLKRTPVLYLSSSEGPSKASSLFFKLEKILRPRPNILYGVFWHTTGEYWAALNLKDKENVLNIDALNRSSIPGGSYAYTTLIGRFKDIIKAIPATFKQLLSHYPLDSTRPSIELYQGFSKVVLFLPTLTPNGGPSVYS